VDVADLVGELLRWIVPAVVVFGVTAAVLTAIGWAVRASRRSPRAVAAAADARTAAGSALVRLDDAVEELDLEVGLSGALYGGGAPASLRRARMTAQHVRDKAFEDFRALDDQTLAPSDVQRRAQLISAHVAEALGIVARARAEHADWVRANSSAATQISAAQERLAHVREQMGDPDALLRGLSDRFDEAEWADAADAATAASAHADEAAEVLARAATNAQDPSRSALSDLALAERRIRAAQSETRRLEEVHRLVTQAAAAVPDEMDAAREAIRQALSLREQLEPDASARLGRAIVDAETALGALERDAARKPTATVAAIARLRDRLDLALGDARTAQQRLRGARSALPGTIATAMNALGRAEASLTGAGAEARVRVAAARDELANARQSADPVEALDAARRALRHAEDAQALAAYDRMAAGA